MSVEVFVSQKSRIETYISTITIKAVCDLDFFNAVIHCIIRFDSGLMEIIDNVFNASFAEDGTALFQSRSKVNILCVDFLIELTLIFVSKLLTHQTLSWGRFGSHLRVWWRICTCGLSSHLR